MRERIENSRVSPFFAVKIRRYLALFFNNRRINVYFPLHRIGNVLRLFENKYKFRILNIREGLFLVNHKSTNQMVFFPFKSINEFVLTQLKFMEEPNGFFLHFKNKYLYVPIEIPSDWTIVDCGSYVGGFSICMAKQHTGKIYAIEPSKYNYEALKLNIALNSLEKNIYPINIGFGAMNEEAVMNISGSGQDDSILTIDSPLDDLNLKVKVSIERFDNFVKLHGLSMNRCFFKLEAEGYEIEVLKGFGQEWPEVISIDISPEREGISPLDEILDILKEQNYITIPPLFNDDSPIALIAYKSTFGNQL